MSGQVSAVLKQRWDVSKQTEQSETWPKRVFPSNDDLDVSASKWKNIEGHRDKPHNSPNTPINKQMRKHHKQAPNWIWKKKKHQWIFENWLSKGMTFHMHRQTSFHLYKASFNTPQ